MKEDTLLKLEAMLDEIEDVNLNEYNSKEEFIVLACGGGVVGGGTVKCGN